MTDVVIVGAGQAGCQVAASLREEGFTGGITLLGAEEHVPYQRPPLSKGHLTGKTQRDKLFLRTPAWFAEQHITLRPGCAVTEIERDACKLRLADGELIGYDVLVLATGSRHRTLDVPGRDLEGVLALRTLCEADALREQLAAARDVVIIGGGFIGLEVAATAAGLGLPTTVLEIGPRLMGRVLSEPTAEFLLGAHRSRGIRVELGTGVRGLAGLHGRVMSVTTSAGEVIPADLVLLGVGALAEDTLARAAGLTQDQGIVVDEYLRTSDPAIHAIGDCARVVSPWAGGASVRLESVQNAVDQARCVAKHIVGNAAPYAALPWFWSDQGDLKLQIAGLTQGHRQTVRVGSADAFSVWCFADDRLVGVESVNSVKDHLTARKILAAGVPLTPAEVAAEGFDPKAVLPA
jgi:3-phenylpropionate/trans-cinnamate dioxygenase ferredoxin reductase subunit